MVQIKQLCMVLITIQIIRLIIRFFQVFRCYFSVLYFIVYLAFQQVAVINYVLIVHLTGLVFSILTLSAISLYTQRRPIRDKIPQYMHVVTSASPVKLYTYTNLHTVSNNKGNHPHNHYAYCTQIMTLVCKTK